MILKNPTNQDVSMVYLGQEYEIKKGKTLEISDEAGAFWKNKIHQFLVVTEEVAKLSPVVKTEAPTAPKEENKEVAPIVKETKVEDETTKVASTPITQKETK